MMAVDTNILVYAHREDSPWHESASLVLAGLVEGNADWAIPWPCVWEFVSVATHPRIYDPPSSSAEALRAVQSWFESPTLRLLAEDGAMFKTMQREITDSRVTGGAVHDARIAAICVRHGVSALLTADRDFSRFSRLRTRNPLLA